MLVVADPAEAVAILGAMRAIGEAGGANTLSDADRRALASAGHVALGLEEAPDPDRLGACTPTSCAS